MAAVLLLLFLAIGLSSCGGARSEGQKQGTPEKRTAQTTEAEEYFFRLKYLDAWGVMRVLVNGFPVHQSGGGRIFDNPVLPISLNTALVGEGNRVTVFAEPYIARVGNNIQIGPVALRGQVTGDYHGDLSVEGAEITEAEVEAAYGAWTKRAREQWRGYLSDEGAQESWALDSVQAWAAGHPLTVSTTFDNEAGPDYSAVFEEAPAIEGTAADTARLIGYAMRLRDLLREDKAEAIYEEIQPAISEETGYASITADSDAGRTQDVAHIREHWDWNTDFERSDVGLRKWSGGRVWELYVKPDSGLFQNEQTSVPVYVAEMAGEIRVVRLN